MDAFAHLSVLISIILGLAITQLLQGLRGIVLTRARVRLYWVPLLWAAIVLVICVQAWWAMFGLRGVREWTFLAFAVVLLEVLAIYMQAAFILPDFVGDGHVDLRQHYFGHLRWFFGSAILTFAASLMKDVVLSGHLPELPNLTFHLVIGGFAVLAALWANERFHKAYAIVTAAMLTVYIVALFARLR
jgi:hypothetical protein